MARIYVPRAPRRNRSRIYTIVSVVIIIVVIAYLYIPGGNQSEPNNSGLITNSRDTVVSSDSEEGSRSQDNSDAGDASLPNTSPDWTSSSSGGTEISSQGQPERGNAAGGAPLGAPTGSGGITPAMQPPVQSVSSEADKLIAEAAAMLNQGVSQIIPARDKYNEALRSRTISVQQAKFVKEKLSSLADDWLFNRVALPGDTLCEHYKVQPGDQLRIIGDKNKITYELIMDLNKISDARTLRAEQNIKIVKGPFHAKVYRSTFTMDVYLQNTYVRTFTVGLGIKGEETPTGLWKVKAGGKLIEPEWTDPSGKTHYPSDPDYPLGSRWIALEGVSGDAVGKQGFAIHGTHKPQELGTASSQGCIRLENGNAILVYNMLVPTYSTVEVLD
ncbi:MAG: L,D-transpeptidase family protein [Sedimentisphaerales bacterium]|nr:L,D-transpeptidase family protein [Sedimentisphaerales bacterium]